jgi:hypothetical protein
MIFVHEHSVIPRCDNRKCEDRLVVTDSFVAVIDGATSKGSSPIEIEAVHVVVEEISTLVRVMPDNISIQEFIESATNRVSLALSAVCPEDGWLAGPPSAGLVMFSLARREIWIVGDGWLMIDGIARRLGSETENHLAVVRSLVAHCLIQNGTTVDELRQHDSSRDAILPILAMQWTLRNRVDAPEGYVQVDGSPIPMTMIEIVSLDGDSHEIVLASDGYLDLESTLEESEKRYSAIVADDPLLISLHKATKGVMAGCNGHDDRTFVRFNVAAKLLNQSLR